MNNLTISGFSTALFSTWFFIDELNLLLDCGDGVTSTLLQKANKVKHIFLSHSHRDHISGLIQFNQLTARKGFPKIYFPENCEEFEIMKNFCNKIDEHAKGAVWQQIKNLQEVDIEKNYFVKAIKNNHIKCTENEVKSFAFQIIEKRKKLKAEFKNYTNKEIKSYILKNKNKTIAEEIDIKHLTFSGDTMVENYEVFDGSKIVIHEATFLGDDETIKDKSKAYQHSRLEEVMKMIAEIKVEKLVLSHFSTRYSWQQIDEAILKLIKKYNIKIPVFRLLPGKFHKNIVNDAKAINN